MPSRRWPDATKAVLSTCPSERHVTRLLPWSCRRSPPLGQSAGTRLRSGPGSTARPRSSGYHGALASTRELTVAACIGTKEFVSGVPHWLRLRTPARDTVLCPVLAYPTYEMGAILARCRAVAVPTRPDGRMDLSSISPDDAARALCLWVNSPEQPGGTTRGPGGRCARWGRAHDVPVFSDECYVEFTWAGPARTILEHGCEGVVAVHSLSKRSNLAGLRAGFYAGDAELVAYLAKLRQHAGFMVPGPVQHAGAVALADDSHVERQRGIYLERLTLFAKVLSEAGMAAAVPQGSFYLWVPVPESLSAPGALQDANPGWALTRWLAEHGGVLVAPGDTYGPAGAGHVRVALVQPDERLELVARQALGGHDRKLIDQVASAGWIP